MPTTPTLYLLSGLPCSGKSTYAESLEAEGVERVSVDELLRERHGRLGVDYEPSLHLKLLGPILEDAATLVTSHLRESNDVVLDHGLGLRPERDRWKQLASQAGAGWELVRFDADLATLRARCALRALSPDTVPISDDVLQEFARSWEPPTGEGERCIDSTADWVQAFYSKTDEWWGEATASIDAVDRARAACLVDLRDATAGVSVLELGCGNGTTAAAAAEAGFTVTGIDFSARIERASTERVTYVSADFMSYEFDQRFDVVTYWDGFGVDDDDGQLALLNRLATHLVQPDGLVVIEVFDPTGFQSDDGLIEHKHADPQRGYRSSLIHARTFDPATHRSVDAWKDVDDDRIWSQSLRCYSPTDFAQLVERSELNLVEILEAGRSDWSYLAVLQPGAPSTA